MNARQQLLAAIRVQLGRDAGPPTSPRPNAPFTNPSTATRAELLQRFTTVLTQVGGHVRVVASIDAAATAIADLLRSHAAQRIALSDAPLVLTLARRLPPTLSVAAATHTALLACDAGITSAQLAIAETGTLVLDSSAERHRLASLLPPLHIVVLESHQLAATLADAVAYAVRRVPTPATLTWITGPSRTADIELTLVIGVHGPKALHVVFIDPPAGT